MAHSFSLAGKNALITGGTRGIGLAIARGFLDCGSRVTICSRKQESVDTALEELSEFGECLQGIAAHVGDPNDLEQVSAAADHRFGPVNILVNNAGTNPYFGDVMDKTY